MAIDFKLPELGEHITSGDVVKVLVQEGQRLEGNQGVIELETEKAVVEIPCPLVGTVVKLHVKTGDTVKVGQSILTVQADSPAESKQREPESKQARDAERVETGARPAPSSTPRPVAGSADGGTILPAGPARRRISRELGVDLRSVHGSGKYGRITPEDVRAAAHAACNRRPVAAAIVRGCFAAWRAGQRRVGGRPPREDVTNP